MAGVLSPLLNGCRVVFLPSHRPRLGSLNSFAYVPAYSSVTPLTPWLCSNVQTDVLIGNTKQWISLEVESLSSTQRTTSVIDPHILREKLSKLRLGICFGSALPQETIDHFSGLCRVVSLNKERGVEDRMYGRFRYVFSHLVALEVSKEQYAIAAWLRGFMARVRRLTESRRQGFGLRR